MKGVQNEIEKLIEKDPVRRLLVKSLNSTMPDLDDMIQVVAKEIQAKIKFNLTLVVAALRCIIFEKP